LHSLTPNILRRIGPDERGFILPVAVIILLVLLLTMTALTLAAADNSTTSRHTGSAAQALAAAQGAEQLALYRLNNAPSSSGATSGTGTFGNGAQYSYTVSSLSSSGSPCAGLYVESSSQTISQDCIKATGTAGGVSQTLDERVAGAAATASLYPVNGLFAVSSISVADTVTGGADWGSNGWVSFTNNISGIKGKLEYQPGYLYDPQGCSGTCQPDPLSSQITVPSLASSYWASAYTTNNDAAITFNGSTRWPNGAQGSTPPSSSNDYVPSLYANNNAINNPDKLGFPADPGVTASNPEGTPYFFCNLYLPQTYELVTNGTASDPVVIFIGGPNCPNGDGSFSTASYETIGNGSDVASALQIYVYGQPGCTTSCPGDLSFNGTLSGPVSSSNPSSYPPFYADIFAPNASWSSANLFSMTGAMTVGSFTANNQTASFNWQSNPGSILPTSTTFYPTASSICSNSAGTGC
jgi:hypothetical protein